MALALPNGGWLEVIVCNEPGSVRADRKPGMCQKIVKIRQLVSLSGGNSIWKRKFGKGVGWAKNKVENKKSSELAFAAPGLYPPPSTSPTLTKLLVERVEGQDARFGVGARTGWVDANHTVFLSAERANTSLVDGDRNCQGDVSNVDATSNRSGTSRE